MIITVVAFQLFIVLSLIVARLVSPKHLLGVALAWSAFTLVAVFASWLLVLQLATVWAAYRMLRPRSAGGAVPCANEIRATLPPHDDQQATKPLIVPKPSQASVKDADLNVTPEKEGGLRVRLERVNEYMRQQLELQEATSDLTCALHAERCLVESALDLARSRRDVVHRGPEFVQLYEEARAEITAVLEDAPKKEISLTEPIKAPDFQISTTNRDSSVARLIEDRVSELRQTREAFLDKCLDELGRDPVLKRLFWQATLDQKQPKLADAFVKYATARTGE